MKHKVFVYGTLMTGMPNNRLLRSSRFIGEAYVQGFDLVDFGPYPGAIDSRSESGVYGELWECDDDTLLALDKLENIPELYFRRLVTTNIRTGDFRDMKCQVYMYVYNLENVFKFVEGGNWRAHLIVKEDRA